MKFQNLPRHVAIIPDGNRRWAKQQHLPTLIGHREGYKRMEELVEESKRLGIEYVTLWAFSTENWKRSQEEREELFSLVAKGLQALHESVLEKRSKFVHLGRKDRLGKELLTLIQALEEETKECTAFTLCVAIDYGGEDEMLRAGEAYKKSEDQDTRITDFLDTSKYSIPSPDFIIRTSGEKRTSGFMPLQSAYSEWYFSDKHFPDFGVQELHDALKDYESRERRHGK
jgi:undecaprenyl diphosphate synthase